MMSYTDPIKTRGVNPGARERYAVPVSLKKPAMVRGSFFSMGTEIFTFLDN